MKRSVIKRRECRGARLQKLGAALGESIGLETALNLEGRIIGQRHLVNHGGRRGKTKTVSGGRPENVVEADTKKKKLGGVVGCSK